MPTKLQTYRALYNFQVDEPDELELQPGDLIDVAIVHPGEWGVGVSRRTQKQGSFPWSYVEKLEDTAQRNHSLALITIQRPWFCGYCQDVIWCGAGRQAYKCSACPFFCHKTCKFFVENNSALECTPDSSASNMPISPATINDWTVDDVRLWLYSIKMEPIEPRFADAGVDGKKLQALTASSLEAMGITEKSHHEMVLAAVQELVEGQSHMMDGDFGQRVRGFSAKGLDSSKLMDFVPLPVPSEKHLEVVKAHKFKVKTFLTPTSCDTCRKYMWGLNRQGLQCIECGYNTHRMCQDLVPQCQPSTYSIVAPGLPGAKLVGTFGCQVDTLFSGADVAPPFVLTVIAALDKALGTKYLYSADVKPTDVNKLRYNLLENPDLQLASCPPTVVAALFKAYFNELADPLCPSESYDKLIAAAKLPSEAEQVAEIDRIVLSFPAQNSRTLTTLLKHLGRVVQNQSSNGMTPDALSRAWGPILVRAPEEFSFKNLFNSDMHVTLVNLMIMKCACGDKPSLTGDAPPPLVPRKRSSISQQRPRLESNYANISELLAKSGHKDAKPPPPRPTAHPRATSGSMGNKALEKYQWFGGSMDRSVAEKVMEPLIDGAFLIRASQSRRGYSLTVKFREIRHVVIVESNNKFGFSEPTTFDSLPDLIKHFERVSLSCYNAELETTLAYPYKTAPQHNTAEIELFDADLTEDVYISNVSALRESIDRQTRDMRYTQRMAAYYSTRVKELQRDLKAQEEILTMLVEQRKLHESFHLDLSEADRKAIMSNFALLKSRLVEADKTYQSISRALRAEKEKEDKAIKKSQMQQAPAATGSKAPMSPRSARRPSTSQAVVAAVPDPAESKFYIGTTPRVEAEKMLEGLPDGTFLVRHSNRSKDPYTLSLRFQGVTKHIQIKYDGTRFGLADPLAFFSLEGLCDYYKKEKLSSTISTRLSRPVKEPY